MQIRKHVQRGMTLIELLVVLVILGLIASIAGPQVMNYASSSKSKAAALQIKDLSNALDIYKLDNGRYPTTQEGLDALIKAPAGASNWRKGYLTGSSVPKDPWHNEYKYASPGDGRDFDIVSYGADGKQGGEGENKDITSWE